MTRAIIASCWTVIWPVAAFFAIGLALMGDPVEGAFAQRQMVGQGLALIAVAIFIFGYWLIFRKRTR